MLLNLSVNMQCLNAWNTQKYIICLFVCHLALIHCFFVCLSFSSVTEHNFSNLKLVKLNMTECPDLIYAINKTQHNNNFFKIISILESIQLYTVYIFLKKITFFMWKTDANATTTNRFVVVYFKISMFLRTGP